MLRIAIPILIRLLALTIGWQVIQEKLTHLGLTKELLISHYVMRQRDFEKLLQLP